MKQNAKKNRKMTLGKIEGLSRLWGHFGCRCLVQTKLLTALLGNGVAVWFGSDVSFNISIFKQFLHCPGNMLPTFT